MDAAASGANDGTSWTHAYNSIQDALTQAAASGGTISEIWLAEGTYMPDGGYIPTNGTHVPGSGDRTASFDLQGNLALYGGFAGGETLLSQRDIEGNPTILSGDLAGDDAPVPCVQDLPDCEGYSTFCGMDGACLVRSNNEENSYTVVRSTDGIAVLDGFTITAGNANAPAGWLSAAGAGLFCEGRPNVVNCTFRGNWAFGGAMYLAISARPIVTDCYFIGNEGGGLVAGSFSRVTITDCRFERNVPDGLLTYDENTSAKIERSVFVRNRRNGIWNFNSGWSTVRNCEFIENYGAGIENYPYGYARVIDSRFIGNRNSAINSTYESSVIAINSVFIGNSTPGNGGAIYTLRPCLSRIINCTFSGNVAGLAGGAIFSENNHYFACADSTTEVANSVFWGNLDSGGKVASAPVLADTGAILNVNHSLVQGGWAGPGGVGIIDADPLFVDSLGPDGIPGTGDEDLRLLFGSPAIDAGDELFLVPWSGTGMAEEIATDLDGHARVLCGAVDMGAYEFAIGDRDCNGTVDLFDVAGFQGCFSGDSNGDPEALPDECLSFDFNADGLVDLADYAAHVAIFGGPLQ